MFAVLVVYVSIILAIATIVIPLAVRDEQARCKREHEFVKQWCASMPDIKSAEFANAFKSGLDYLPKETK